jgi:hypothetical protein
MNDNRIRLVCLIALATMAVLLTACGGDSKPKAPAGTPENPLIGRKTEAAAHGGGSAAGRTNEAAKSQGKAGASGSGSSDGPGYQKLVERQSSNPRSKFTPCNLVTRAQASAILGAPIQQPLEAPQGPTCIYRSKNGASFITVAVQSIDLAKIRPHLRQRRRVEISHRVAYCGRFGQPMLYVALADGRVLSIAGPCDVAKRFATKALRQL